MRRARVDCILAVASGVLAGSFVEMFQAPPKSSRGFAATKTMLQVPQDFQLFCPWEVELVVETSW